MLIDAVSAMTDDAWDRSAQNYHGGKKVIEQPVISSSRYIMFDAIRHHGQLTAYRAADGRQGARGVWAFAPTRGRGNRKLR